MTSCFQIVQQCDNVDNTNVYCQHCQNNPQVVINKLKPTNEDITIEFSDDYLETLDI